MRKKIIATIIAILVVMAMIGGYLFVMRGEKGQAGVLDKNSDNENNY